MPGDAEEQPDTYEAAYANLVQAVERFDRANKNPGGEAGLLIDWLLVTASYYDHGDHTATAMGQVGPPHQAVYRSQGLVAWAAAYFGAGSGG